MKYTVKQLSKLSGVSVRTLHHYDDIGLLKPANRSSSGYRYYEKAELLRLQQILFYRELDFPLKEIAEILNDPFFDLISALEFHKTELGKRQNRLEKLMATVEKTISELKNKNHMMTDKEIYEGFKPEEVEPMKKEVAERWGEDKLMESESRIRSMGKDKWEKLKQEGGEIYKHLASLMFLPPSDQRVQKVIQKHKEHIGNFYEVKEEIYRGLGNLYVEDERFKAFYEKIEPGLAEFIREAIKVYCDNGMKVA